jgi:hypothetical protein
MPGTGFETTKGVGGNGFPPDGSPESEQASVNPTDAMQPTIVLRMRRLVARMGTMTGMRFMV